MQHWTKADAVLTLAVVFIYAGSAITIVALLVRLLLAQ